MLFGDSQDFLVEKLRRLQRYAPIIVYSQQ
jgi:hypothetical protein